MVVFLTQSPSRKKLRIAVDRAKEHAQKLEARQRKMMQAEKADKLRQLAFEELKERLKRSHQEKAAVQASLGEHKTSLAAHQAAVMSWQHTARSVNTFVFRPHTAHLRNLAILFSAT